MRNLKPKSEQSKRDVLGNRKIDFVEMGRGRGDGGDGGKEREGEVTRIKTEFVYAPILHDEYIHYASLAY